MTETYDRIGRGYATQRHADQRIALAIRSALGDCGSILNVGAGTGSYEPADLEVVAVEPSFTMIRQRPGVAAPAVQARAEALPFRDASFDGVLGVLTLHHWQDLKLGLAECRRVARRRIVFFTIDLDVYDRFWLLQEYFPDILALDRAIFPPICTISKTLGPLDVTRVAIPADCTDGFLGAYWRRPEAYLDPNIRAGMSTFSKVSHVEERLSSLRRDLNSGLWEYAHSVMLAADEHDLGYRLLVAHLP